MESTVSSSKIILLFSGSIAAGKTSICNVLTQNYHFRRVSTGSYLQNHLSDTKSNSGRTTLQDLGDRFDLNTNFKWVLDDVFMPALSSRPSQQLWIFDSARKLRQVELFRNHFGTSLHHIHLSAPENILKSRYENRKAVGDEYANSLSYEDVIQHPNEKLSRSMFQFANLAIDTEIFSPEEIASQIINHIQGKK